MYLKTWKYIALLPLFLTISFTVPSYAQTFTLTGNLHTARQTHTATLLNSGQVLIAGGYTNGAVVGSAELYNPTTGAFTVSGSLKTPRYRQTATLLNNGKVLIAGGYTSNGVLRLARNSMTPLPGPLHLPGI